MKPFEVGDAVTDLRVGYGFVKEITIHDTYPVICDFDSETNRTYTTEGRFRAIDKFPTLIHGHPESISIVKHKTKTK